MSSESPSKNLGRWRQSNSRPSRQASPTKFALWKWSRAAVLGSLLAAAVAGMAYVIWVIGWSGRPDPYLVAFWVDEYQLRSAFENPSEPNTALSGLIPQASWVAADWRRLLDSKVFTRLDSQAEETRNPTRAEIETRLDGLRSRPPGESVVVFLSAYSTIDEEGKVRILAYDSNPFRRETLVPLGGIFDRLRKCPARQKLLILDVMRNTPDPMDLAGVADGVADVIRKEIEGAGDSRHELDPNLLVLGNCGPGQTALGSETLGQSAFGHYLRIGLTGLDADANGDRLVTVKELASYLTKQVDDWAIRQRGARQTPFLVGSAPDFALAAPSGSTRSGTGLSLGFLRWPWGGGASKAAASPDAEKAPADGEALAKKEEAKDPAKAESESKTANAKGKEAGKAEQDDGYPAWLASGWAIRERAWNDGDAVVAPRAFRRLEKVLLRAEAGWRGGGDPSVIQADLKGELVGIEDALRRGREIPRPRRPRSLGQALAFGMTADPGGALAKALVTLTTVPLDKVDPIARKTFVEQAKTKTSLDLAAAVVAAMDRLTFAPKVLEFLDGLVAETLLPRDVIELRTLHALAVRGANPPAGWSVDLARQAWEVARTAERAGSRPSSLAWVIGSLTEADALRQDAEALSLREASGAVPPGELAEAWERAGRAYSGVTEIQDRIEEARTIRDRVMARLRSSIPYMEIEGGRRYEDAWQGAAGAVLKIDQLLKEPTTPPTTDSLESLARDLGTAKDEAARQLAMLERPFLTPSIDELIALCRRKVDPDAGLVGQVDAILTTPFPSLADRRRLWRASLDLQRRLVDTPAESAASRSTEREALALGGLRERLDRRASRLTRLMELSGEAATARGLSGFRDLVVKAMELRTKTGSDLALDMNDSRKIWKTVGELTRLVRDSFEERVSHDRTIEAGDRLGWVAPVFLLDWKANPSRVARAREAVRAWSWLADRYVQQSRDLFDPDLADTPAFYRDAATECRVSDTQEPRGVDQAAEVYLEINPTGPAPRLSPQAPNAEIALQVTLRAPAGSERRKVVLELARPDDSRYQVAAPEPSEIELTPLEPVKVALRVHWSEDETASATAAVPTGFFVSARLPDRRAYHRVVTTRIEASVRRPKLLVGRDPAAPGDPLPDRIRVRPVPGRQAFYLHVRNPSPMPREFAVEVSPGNAGPPIKLKVPAGETAAVPSLGATPPKPTDPLGRLSGPVTLRLRDAATGEILDERKLEFEVATPRDYLEDFFKIVEAKYTPAAPMLQKNRLAVTLQARPGLADPPCEVALRVPRESTLFPALQEAAKGTLTGQLMPKGTVTVMAEDLVLDPSVSEEGAFALDVDGYERALWFRALFLRDAAPQAARPDNEPRVRVSANFKVDPSPATVVARMIVDNAPAGARLRAKLGPTGPNGQFIDAATLLWTAAAKDVSLGFDARGENGALLLEAGVKDWVHVFQVPGRRGQQTLEVQMIDVDGNDLPARDVVTLTLDDQAPEDARLLVPPPFVQGFPAVKLRGTITPPAAGIREVTFFVGSKQADLEAAKAAGQVAQGKPTDEARRSWEALLPIPKDKSGAIPVAVVFTSKTGISSFATNELTINEPPPPPPPPPSEDMTKKKKEPEPPKPGSIQGKVVEGERPQVGLEVALFLVNPDPDAKEKLKPIATTKTKAGGVFEFQDLPAGTYRLYSLKAINNRRDIEDVPVEAGKAASVTLELLLP